MRVASEAFRASVAEKVARVCPLVASFLWASAALVAHRLWPQGAGAPQRA